MYFIALGVDFNKLNAQIITDLKRRSADITDDSISFFIEEIIIIRHRGEFDTATDKDVDQFYIK